MVGGAASMIGDSVMSKASKLALIVWWFNSGFVLSVSVWMCRLLLAANGVHRAPQSWAGHGRLDSKPKADDGGLRPSILCFQGPVIYTGPTNMARNAAVSLAANPPAASSYHIISYHIICVRIRTPVDHVSPANQLVRRVAIFAYFFFSYKLLYLCDIL